MSKITIRSEPFDCIAQCAPNSNENSSALCRRVCPSAIKSFIIQFCRASIYFGLSIPAVCLTNERNCARAMKMWIFNTLNVHRRWIMASSAKSYPHSSTACMQTCSYGRLYPCKITKTENILKLNWWQRWMCKQQQPDPCIQTHAGFCDYIILRATHWLGNLRNGQTSNTLSNYYDY